MTPIILPSPNDVSWQRAATIARTLRARGMSNSFIVAAVSNAYAESGWRPVIAGDNGKSFGPWQINYGYFGAQILEATNVDIRTEGDLAKHVDALLWLISTPPFAKTLAAIEAGKTGADATLEFVIDFERASALGAAERRVAIAPFIEVWLSKLPA